MAERIEIDAKEVLDKYIALIRKTGGRSPQDVSDLPAPKPVIKAVLLHVLRIAPRDADVAPIKQAYLALATFQDQEGVAKVSLDGWLERMTEQSDPSMSDAELRAVAQRTGSVRAFLDSIEEQVEAERALLTDELAKAGV